jgi:hypothetical protein
MATLAAAAPQGMQGVVLDADRPGLEQIREALAGRQDLTALYWINHGSAGVLDLGSSTLRVAATGRSKPPLDRSKPRRSPPPAGTACSPPSM